jgi:hypothetical protein
MSANQNQNTLMSPEEAYDVLVANAHAPFFFEKLAKVYNIVPKTAQHAKALLQMAGALRNVHEAELTKAAAAEGDLVIEAKRDLDNILSQFGYQPLPDNDPGVKQAAWNLANSPLLREAALVWQHHMNNAG